MRPPRPRIQAIAAPSNRALAMITTLATKLRLSVQADVDRRSRKIDERPAPAALDPLLGGAAVVRLTSRRPRRGPDDGQLD